MDLAGQSARGDDRGFAAEFADRVFNLKILDPAMGSGHFLTSAIDYLAREIIDAQEKQATQQGIESVNRSHDINWARRQVAQRCIYGVDINPLATELAKVSLWLRTLAAEQPLAFLDHHLKTGNSLVGSDIQHVLTDNDESKTDKGQLTLEQSFAHTRKQALDHVMDRFSELLAIDNETLEDAKEMEEVYQSVQNDPLYQKLLEMANVHTASQFGLDVPGDADKRMAEALRRDSWKNIAGQDWFKSAQTIADDEHFFHWELEFPVAFYDIDGNRMENAGFDAVIGNPPYVSSRNEDFYEVMGEFVDSRYDLAVYQVDLYLLFTELGVDLTCDGGTWSYIEPDVWLGNVKGDDVRRWLVKHEVIKKFALPEKKVFDADVDCLILIGVSTKNGTDTVDVSKISEDEEIESYEVELPENGDVFPISENASLLSKVEQESIELDKIAKTGRGIGPYHHSKHSEETIETRAYHSDQQEDETYRPELAGKDIDRYVLNWDGDRWISYGDWLAEPREPELFEGERLLCRKILAKRLRCAYVDDDWLADQQVYIASQFKNGYRAQYAAAILASSLMGFYARTKYHEDTDLFPHLRVAQFRELPIREMTFNITESVRKKRFDEKKNIIDNTFKSDLAENLPEVAFEITNDEHLEVVHDSIVYLVEVLTETKRKRSNHNLNLLDYLSAYEEGSNLPDIGLFQPAKSNILDAKTGEYDKLQIERIKIEQNGSQLTIYATARYKPENKDDFETDTYGYTETDFREAFTLNNLSDKEVTLVEAFVPVAVDKADGFANFRDNATKTNSLIDRLKSMTLPNIDDVEDDLKRYMEVKERADELDEKIEKTDQLIDEIIYRLYGLTDEEIKIVESETQND
jgi:hypothetical protein